MNTPLPEAIKSAAGALAGNVYQGADKLYYLYGTDGKFMGTFNPIANATYNAYGQFVNYGNQFRAMLGV